MYCSTDYRRQNVTKCHCWIPNNEVVVDTNEHLSLLTPQQYKVTACCAENDGAHQNHGNHLFGDQQLQGYLKNNQDTQQYEATACCAGR